VVRFSTAELEFAVRHGIVDVVTAAGWRSGATPGRPVTRRGVPAAPVAGLRRPTAHGRCPPRRL